MNLLIKRDIIISIEFLTKIIPINISNCSYSILILLINHLLLSNLSLSLDFLFGYIKFGDVDIMFVFCLDFKYVFSVKTKLVFTTF